MIDIYSAWMPIETAPKNTTVLIYAKPDMAVAFSDADNDGAWTLDDGHGYCTRRHLANPTHWMPLPAPPTEHIEGFAVGKDKDAPSA